MNGQSSQRISRKILANVKFEFSCFNVLRFAPYVIVKNSRWKRYYEFAKFYTAMSYSSDCVKCINLYFKFITDLKSKYKLEILSENVELKHRSGIPTCKKNAIQNFAKLCWQI